uniref:Uncharacterized protein n=1 Tax=Pithovirus LCPAC103 TaxID=2506588 RepID=A0A481Z4H0_9VIRU|nr:MAG: hypothetical protein LCPAC103_00960 [Pithovirus LCPAC103]
MEEQTTEIVVSPGIIPDIAGTVAIPGTIVASSTAGTVAIPGTIVASSTATSSGSGYKTITWTDISMADLIPGAVEPKQYETTGKDEHGIEVTETGTYYDIPIMYCPGGDPTKVKPEHIYMEGPPIVSFGGITAKLMGGKMVYSIKLSFRSPAAKIEDDPIYDETARQYKDFNTKIWLRTGQFIEANKDSVKLTHFSAASAETLQMCLYKNKVFTPTDDFTKEPLEDKSTMYVKLLNWESTKDGSTDRTKFVDVDGNIIDWSKLRRNLIIVMIPNLYIRKIYVSAKPSLQVTMKSAVVLSVKLIEQKTPQLETIMRLKAAFPNLGNSLRNELAALEDEGISDPPLLGTTITESSSGKYEAGTMHTMTEGGSTPPISSDHAI